MHNFSRQQHYSAPSSSEKRLSLQSRTVTIIDPAFRSGKVDIPIEKTTATKGRDEWLEGKLRNRDLSLCCLFQKGRCHAQERCHQVHADRDYVTSLRDQQRAIVSCCRHCHDTASLTAAAISFFATNMPTTNSVLITFGEFDDSNTVQASRVAYTDGLIQQFRDHGCKEVNGAISIPARRVCRLHAKGVCKYGKDCKNVHVCCELGEAVMVRPVPKAAKATSTPQQVQSSPAPQPPKPVSSAPPLPAFAAPVTIVPTKDPLEKTATMRSQRLTALDADSLNESSGRLRALVFDVLKCLDDSRVDAGVGKASENDDDNFSYFSSTKTSSRQSNATDSPNTKALQWGAWHPCSNTKLQNIVSPAAVDANAFLTYF